MNKDEQLEIEFPGFALSLKIQEAIIELEGYKATEIHPAHQDRLMNLSNKIAKSQLKRGRVITSPEHSRSSIRELLQSKQEEVMAVLFLDSKHRIISFDELFH